MNDRPVDRPEAPADVPSSAARQLRLLLDSAPLAVIAFDGDLTLTLCEGAAIDDTGLLAHHRIGQSLVELLGPRPDLLDLIRRCASGESIDTVVVVRDQHWDTRLRPVTNADGAAAGGLLISFDVTERVLAENERALSEQRFRAVAETAREGIWLLDSDARVTFANTRMLEMFGLPAEAVIGRSALDILPDRPRHEAAFERRRAGQQEEFDATFTRPDGAVLHGRVSAGPLFDDAGNFLGSLSMITDVSAYKDAEEALSRVLLQDSVTGLANRVLLHDRLEHALARRDDRPVSVIFIDLDRFKQVNESLGHSGGDELLRRVGARVRETVRPGATVARLGADEFVIVCERTDTSEAFAVADTVAQAVAEPLSIGGVNVLMRCSIGVATSDGEPINADTLLRAADSAAVRARERGRGRIEVFDQSLQAAITDRLRTVSELRHALADGDLVVYYQPIHRISDGRLVDAEALVRWKHRDRGLLGPLEFIGIAEDSGLIGELGAFVLRRACEQAAAWTTPIGVSVNLSPHQLVDPELAGRVAAVLRETRLAPDRLTLEVTESAVMTDAAVGLATLEALKETGVRLAIDDFGTGYSSLAYLKRFPVDTLKIDKSFIDELDRDAADARIVGSIVTLAHSLDIEATAEGVEHQGQLDALVGLGCDTGQGYLWGRPAPVEDLYWR